MKIEKISIANYKSVEQAEILFPRFYSAICGRNNAGKTTVLAALRALFIDGDFEYFEDESRSAMKEFPFWKRDKSGSHITRVSVTVRLFRKADLGIFRFVETFLESKQEKDDFELELNREFDCDKGHEILSVSVEGNPVTDTYKAQEIHKKFRSARAYIFHNSTVPDHPYFIHRNLHSFFSEVSEDDRKNLTKANQRVLNVYKAIAKRYKKDIEETLGKLEEKYEVGLSVPTFDIDRFPFSLTLSDRKVELPLSDWGSGTQNRTKIFLAILRAKKITESASESDKITPFIIIEEPECFLHPSAQAEFGGALRDLSEDLGIQVICTSHSPYMLSVEHPESNVLLQRKTVRGQELETEVVDTSGDRWMEPFALSLGLDNSAFAEWKDVLFKRGDSILLVEGETDKEYFEMLRNEQHGSNKLCFAGEIFPYGGTGFFGNSILLKFVLARFDKVFVTFDHDAKEVPKKLESLGLKKGKHFHPIGKDEPGKNSIEGLLPADVDAVVFSKYSGLVNRAIGGDRQARDEIKKIKLQEFKRIAKPGKAHFGEFYAIVKLINSAFKT